MLVCVPEPAKEVPKPERPTPLFVPLQSLVEGPPSPNEEEEEEEGGGGGGGGIPIPSSGLLQVVERRQPLSSVSSLEVHFDLLDLTELTDMSDQELAEVFADSDEENAPNEPHPGLHPHSHPNARSGYLRSPSWTRTKGEQGREKKRLSDPELPAGKTADSFLALEKPAQE
uniref:Dysbindin domain-containing protein 1 n=1 Tax=Anolis carolinensis TaxID=28377 RepID=H9GFH4_ANOCA